MIKHPLRNLTCPRCRAPNFSLANPCQCGFAAQIVSGVPVLRDLPAGERMDYRDATAQPPHYDSLELTIPEVTTALKSGGYCLELGAGHNRCDLPNLVKTDAFVYSSNLDAVADAHNLPFADNTFDFVFSLAVYEHLHSPWIATDETYRVLKPGGTVYCLCAFMQHVHGYPHHYFNPTIYGMRHLFSRLENVTARPSAHAEFSELAAIVLHGSNMFRQAPRRGIVDAIAKPAGWFFTRAAASFLIRFSELLKRCPHGEGSEWEKVAPAIELVGTKPR